MQLQNLHTKRLGRTFLYFDTLDSTNNYLKEHAMELPDGTAVVAALQTAGKGRLGRNWKMQPGDTLAISILFRPAPIEDSSILPLLSGMATARAITDLCGATVQIKWPNDLVIGEKKVTGILCESRIVGNSGFLISGIGVNTHATAEYYQKCGLPYAGSIQMCTGISVSHEKLACRILEHLETIYDQYKKDGFQSLIPEYCSMCVNLGKEVRVIYQEHEVIGKAVSIRKDGALVVETDEGIIFVSSGEASVRGLYGYI